MLLGVVKNKNLRMGGLTEDVCVFSGAQNLLCMSKEHTVHSWTAALGGDLVFSSWNPHCLISLLF